MFDKKFHYVPGIPVEVTDAVGAGDAFSAAFMHCYFRCEDTVRSAKIANEVGAYVTTKCGAIPTYSALIKKLLGTEVESEASKAISKLNARNAL